MGSMSTAPARTSAWTSPPPGLYVSRARARVRAAIGPTRFRFLFGDRGSGRAGRRWSCSDGATGSSPIAPGCRSAPPSLLARSLPVHLEIGRAGLLRPAAGPIGDWIESASEKAPTPPGLYVSRARARVRAAIGPTRFRFLFGDRGSGRAGRRWSCSDGATGSSPIAPGCRSAPPSLLARSLPVHLEIGRAGLLRPAAGPIGDWIKSASEKAPTPPGLYVSRARARVRAAIGPTRFRFLFGDRGSGRAGRRWSCSDGATGSSPIAPGCRSAPPSLLARSLPVHLEIGRAGLLRPAAGPIGDWIKSASEKAPTPPGLYVSRARARVRAAIGPTRFRFLFGDRGSGRAGRRWSCSDGATGSSPIAPGCRSAPPSLLARSLPVHLEIGRAGLLRPAAGPIGDWIESASEKAPTPPGLYVSRARARVRAAIGPTRFRFLFGDRGSGRAGRRWSCSDGATGSSPIAPGCRSAPPSLLARSLPVHLEIGRAGLLRPAAGPIGDWIKSASEKAPTPPGLYVSRARARVRAAIGPTRFRFLFGDRGSGRAGRRWSCSDGATGSSPIAPGCRSAPPSLLARSLPVHLEIGRAGLLRPAAGPIGDWIEFASEKAPTPPGLYVSRARARVRAAIGPTRFRFLFGDRGSGRAGRRWSCSDGATGSSPIAPGCRSAPPSLLARSLPVHLEIGRAGLLRPAAGPIGDWIESASEKAPTPPGLYVSRARARVRAAIGPTRFRFLFGDRGSGRAGRRWSCSDGATGSSPIAPGCRSAPPSLLARSLPVHLEIGRAGLLRPAAGPIGDWIEFASEKAPTPPGLYVSRARARVRAAIGPTRFRFLFGDRGSGRAGRRWSCSDGATGSSPIAPGCRSAPPSLLARSLPVHLEIGRAGLLRPAAGPIGDWIEFASEKAPTPPGLYVSRARARVRAAIGPTRFRFLFGDRGSGRAGRRWSCSDGATGSSPIAPGCRSAPPSLLARSLPVHLEIGRAGLLRPAAGPIGDWIEFASEKAPTPPGLYVSRARARVRAAIGPTRFRFLFGDRGSGRAGRRWSCSDGATGSSPIAPGCRSAPPSLLARSLPVHLEIGRAGLLRPAAGPIGDWIESASEKAPTPPGLYVSRARARVRAAIGPTRFRFLFGDRGSGRAGRRWSCSDGATGSSPIAPGCRSAPPSKW